MDLNDLQALMGDSLGDGDLRDLWVVDLDPLPTPPNPDLTDGGGAGGGKTWPLLGEARRLADSLGAYVHYVGPADSAEAIAFGADRVHPLTAGSGDAALAALGPYFDSHRPEFVFLPATPMGNEIAGRLAHRLKGGVVLNCIAVRLDESTRELVGSHPVYDGAYFLDTAIAAKPAIVTVSRGAFALPLRDPGRSGEVEPLDSMPVEGRVRALGPVEYTPAEAPLHKAARVVAVGRAGNDPGSVELAKAIASKIGAHFAGDRSAFDSGWVAQEQIVGVIGTEIAPDIYIAAGIWGDTLHRAGVEGAKYIVAIHPDKNAPIFQYADAAIVGAPKDVLPKLIALL
jgi:electron transfer flavoprotein alpha subunit